MTLEIVVWGSNDENSFQWCFLCFQTCPALSVCLSPSDGRDYVDDILFPCFLERKRTKSVPMHVN